MLLPPPIIGTRCSVRNALDKAEKGAPLTTGAVTAPNVFLVIVRLLVPLVINGDVGAGGVIDAVHVGLEARSMSISIPITFLNPSID